jgi:exosome complex component RRP46
MKGLKCSVLTILFIIAIVASKEKEYEQIIRETFTPVVLTDSFPRAVISIVVQVIEDDGSLLAVAINAVSLALMDAGVPMVSVVTATSCGILDDGSLNLDPTSAEEEVTQDRELCRWRAMGLIN